MVLREPTVSKGQENKNTRIYKRVAGAVLVAVGLEGLCLHNPQLVPAENNESIAAYVTSILMGRRAVLGSLSAPAGFVTDSIRKHRKVLSECFNSVYPEVEAASRSTAEGSQSVLMLQDIAHRE